MNFKAMSELDVPWAYHAVVGITVVVCATLYWVLRRAKWL